MNAMLLASVFLIGQYPAVKEVEFPRVHDFPIVQPSVPISPPIEDPYAYYNASAESLKTGKPLVVFVRCVQREVAGAITVRVEQLAGYVGPTIVLGRPENRSQYFVAELGSEASVSEILARLAVKAAPAPFGPFSSNNQRSTAQAAADGLAGKAGGLQFDPSHNCPKCKAEQKVISYYIGNGNMHVHTCKRCGTSWVH